MAVEQPQQISPASPTGKKRGCLFWAIATLVVLALVVGGGSYLAYRYATQRIVAGYTEAAPRELAEPTLSAAELGELDGRVAAFVHALRNKNPVEPLVLSGDDLTALVARIPELRRLGGRARFSIGDGEIRSDLSLPLERAGYPGRWFNGSAAFAVSLENGVLIVTLRSASVKGSEVPGWILRQVQDQNLAKKLYERPETASVRLAARVDRGRQRPDHDRAARASVSAARAARPIALHTGTRGSTSLTRRSNCARWFHEVMRSVIARAPSACSVRRSAAHCSGVPAAVHASTMDDENTGP